MSGCPFASRRGFLGAAGGLVAAIGTARAAAAVNEAPAVGKIVGRTVQEPFYARNQGGIVTARQTHTCLAAFDLVTDKPAELVRLMQAWTAAAARLTRGPARRVAGRTRPRQRRDDRDGGCPPDADLRLRRRRVRT